MGDLVSGSPFLFLLLAGRRCYGRNDRSLNLSLRALLDDTRRIAAAVYRKVRQDAQHDKRRSQHPGSLFKNVWRGAGTEYLLGTPGCDARESAPLAALQQDYQRHQKPDEGDNNNQESEHRVGG